MTHWAEFVHDYHAAHPGITEDLLTPMCDRAGRDPYTWLVEGLPTSGLIWDACCGSAPVADKVGLDRYRGIDTSDAELDLARERRPGVRVRAGDAGLVQPPAGPALISGVTVAMALMLLDLDAFLTRVATFLPPGAPLQAIVPTRTPISGAGDFATTLTLLGQSGIGYREPLPPQALPGRFAAAGFDLTSDETALFQRPVPDLAAADLIVDSFYAPGVTPAQRGEASRWLAGRLAEPGYTFGYPIRRICARRRLDSFQ